MAPYWQALANAAGFLGAIIITAAAAKSFFLLLKRWAILEARLSLASGVINGLEFMLAGTLLKALALSQWHQIGMLAGIYSIRIVLKQAFLREQNSATRHMGIRRYIH